MIYKNDYIFSLNEASEKELWGNCCFVFDTSALLDLYYYSEESLEEFEKSILQVLKDRLWIPNFVKYEFMKHREEKIKIPLRTYEELLSKKSNNNDTAHLSKIEEALSSIKNIIETFSQRTKNSEKHPTLNQENINDFILKINDFERNFSLFKKNITEEINAIKEKLLEGISLENDKISNLVENYLMCGEPFGYEEMLELAIIGEKRFMSRIPPGYEDIEKEGLAKFGDLYIWKQIVNYAKLTGKNIVLITNDTKEDWCIRIEKNKDRIQKPREELIFEIKSIANVNFWMYTMSQFLYKSREIIKSKINQDAIDEIERISTNIRDIKILDIIYEWVKSEYPNSEIITEKKINNDYIADLFVELLNSSTKIVIEIRGSQIPEYLLKKIIIKAESNIEKKHFDKFILLFVINESDRDYFFDIKNVFNSMKKSNSIDVLSGYCLNNSFILYR